MDPQRVEELIQRLLPALVKELSVNPNVGNGGPTNNRGLSSSSESTNAPFVHIPVPVSNLTTSPHLSSVPSTRAQSGTRSICSSISPGYSPPRTPSIAGSPPLCRSPPYQLRPSSPPISTQATAGLPVQSPPIVSPVPRYSYPPSSSPGGRSFRPETPSPPTQPPITVPVGERHESYYLDDGNVEFLIQGTLFRVHKFFFKRDSVVFRELLRENVDRSPIKLTDCNALDFERFLGVLYPAVFHQYTASTLEEWTSILALATQWGFDSIRLLAIREVFRLGSPLDRIVLAHKFDIKEWLLDAYREICERQDPLSDEEAERIGAKDTARVARVRERRRLSTYFIPPPAPEPDATLQSMVETEFKLVAENGPEDSDDESESASEAGDQEDAPQAGEAGPAYPVIPLADKAQPTCPPSPLPANRVLGGWGLAGWGHPGSNRDTTFPPSLSPQVPQPAVTQSFNFTAASGSVVSAFPMTSAHSPAMPASGAQGEQVYDSTNIAPQPAPACPSEKLKGKKRKGGKTVKKG